MKSKFDGFVIALFVSIALAYFFPELYSWKGGAVLSWITSIGVSLIFFFYGLKLSLVQLKTGLRNWKLHLLVQGSTFILFPLLLLPFYPFINSQLQHDFWLSFFFLAALPSTVSSSVVMVSIAGGNMPAAIFNASISGLIGVLVTPLWMQSFLEVGEMAVFGDIYWGLIKEIILPVVAGLLLQPFLGNWIRSYGKQLSLFDKVIILFIVYGSFAESFVEGIFEHTGKLYLLWTALGSMGLFVAVYGILYFCTRYLLKFNQEDQITALFCGSKKSLTHGSVFGKFLFAHSASSGLYFLPLMIFHTFQILVVTIIAQRYQEKQSKQVLPQSSE